MSSTYIFQLRSSIFIFLFVDHVLLGQVMETVNVTDEFECHRKCIQNNTCKSFNVHPRESNPIKKTCEMNNQTRQMKPKQYKKKIGSSYHGSVEVSLICISFPFVVCGNNPSSKRISDRIAFFFILWWYFSGRKKMPYTIFFPHNSNVRLYMGKNR